MKNLFHPHPAKKISLSGNELKIIACVTMFLDHFAKVFQAELDSSLYFVLDNIIGRLAFPLFCLLLAEGYFHTRNLRKYMIRVALLALVSEIPFNLAMSGQFFDPRWQNTVFTLLLGLLMFCFLDIIRSRSDPVRLPAVLLQILTVLASAAAAWFLRTDYDVFGIGALACFYYLNFQKSPDRRSLGMLLSVPGTGSFSVTPSGGSLQPLQGKEENEVFLLLLLPAASASSGLFA